MDILILGSGGREHAFAWKIRQSPLCKKLFIAPGNAGPSALGTNVPINPNNFQAVNDFVIQNQINMVIVGPEEPLVMGIVDYFKKDDLLKDIPVIGPSAEGAQLEGSKAYSKQFMIEMGIPTAAYQKINDLEKGIAFLKTLTPPYVLKADGLAAGKGVLILDTLAEAEKELSEMLTGKFGSASATVVIEEFLSGIEFSVFVLTDGKDYKILPVAKDYKRVGEGDTGLNTGGMGAVSPVPFVDALMMQKVEERIIKPTIAGLKAKNIDYKGFVFIGLISVKGEPIVIEYNCRMGDPETEVVIPRLQNDLVELFSTLHTGKLSQVQIQEDPQTATTIVLTAGGYPGDYQKGDPITGTEWIPDSLIFHAGTKRQAHEIVTNGGRVMAITSLGKDIPTALALSNKNAAAITFNGKNYRKDIGLDLTGHLKWRS